MERQKTARLIAEILLKRQLPIQVIREITDIEEEDLKWIRKKEEQNQSSMWYYFEIKGDPIVERVESPWQEVRNMTKYYSNNPSSRALNAMRTSTSSGRLSNEPNS